jgi:hypothetical protein
VTDCKRSPPNLPGLKLKIISFADGQHAMELSQVSGRVNSQYASLHGFGFHIYHDCRPRIRHLQWTKIPLFYLELNDPNPAEWIMFVDADLVFTEMDYDVYSKFLSRLPPEVFLVVAEDIGGGRPINTGLMALRSGHDRSMELVRLIWNTGRNLKVEQCVDIKFGLNFEKKKKKKKVFACVV